VYRTRNNISWSSRDCFARSASRNDESAHAGGCTEEGEGEGRKEGGQESEGHKSRSRK